MLDIEDVASDAGSKQVRLLLVSLLLLRRHPCLPDQHAHDGPPCVPKATMNTHIQAEAFGT